MFIINENCSQKWMIKKCKTFFKVIQNFAIVKIILNYIFIFTSSFFSFIYGVILKILIDDEKEFHTQSYFSCTNTFSVSTPSVEPARCHKRAHHREEAADPGPLWGPDSQEAP